MKELGELEEQVKQEVKGLMEEKGITTEDEDAFGVVEDAFAVAGADERWWQCRGCKTYIDAFAPAGAPRKVVAIDRLRCPDCHGMEFDTVEGNYFKKGLRKAKGIYVPPADPEFIRCVQEAKAAMRECDLFPDAGDAQGQEEYWPRAIAIAILGAGLYVGRKR